MAFVFLTGFQRVWYSVNKNHVDLVKDIVEMIKQQNVYHFSTENDNICKLNLSEEGLVSVKWVEEVEIVVQGKCAGKLFLLDTKPNMGLTRVKKSSLQNIANSISLLVQIRQEAYRNSLDVMADVLHDVRTPIMALNMNLSVLQHLNDDLMMKLSMSNNCGSAASNSPNTVIPLSSNIAGKFQRSIDVISTIVTYINNSTDEYASIRKSYLVSDSNSAGSHTVSCNVGQVIEESYVSVYSSDYSKRCLCIDRTYFQNTPVLAHPDAVHLLVSLTMKALLLKYEYVSVCVRSSLSTVDINGNEMKSKKSKSLILVKNLVGQREKSHENELKENHSMSSLVTVTVKFSCSRINQAKTQTSENKEKQIWGGILRVLELLRGNIRHSIAPADEPPSDPQHVNMPMSGSSSVAPYPTASSAPLP